MDADRAVEAAKAEDAKARVARALMKRQPKAESVLQNIWDDLTKDPPKDTRILANFG